jgi:hypothetical protein
MPGVEDAPGDDGCVSCVRRLRVDIIVGTCRGRWLRILARPPRGQLRQPAQDILRMPWGPGLPRGTRGRGAALPLKPPPALCYSLSLPTSLCYINPINHLKDSRAPLASDQCCTGHWLAGVEIRMAGDVNSPLVVKLL